MAVEWLHISRSEGCGNYTITVTADTNTELNERLGRIIISGKTKSLSAMTDISQAAQVTYTAINFSGLTWLTDIAASGGTATKDNCSYWIIGTKSDGTTKDVTSLCNVTGSLVVASSTTTTRHSAGTLTLTATMDSLSCNASVTAYQEGDVAVNSISFSALTWAIDVPWSGGTANKDNCTYWVIATYSDGTSKDVTSACTITGEMAVASSTTTYRHYVGYFYLNASYKDKTTQGSVFAYQAAFVKELTSISWSALTWVTDIKYTGGTATSANCSYYIIGYYNDSSSANVTSSSTISGELAVSASTETTRHSAGTLTLSAVCSGFSAVDSVVVYQQKYVEPQDGYVNFTSDGPVYLSLSGSHSTNYEYSYDKTTWNTWGRGLTQFGTTDKPTLYIRGKNTNGPSGDTFVLSTSAVSVALGGNAMALIDWETLPDTVPNYAFFYTFKNMNGLVTVSEDFLPATSVGTFGYNAMFFGCTSLTSAPNVQATSFVGENACSYMFAFCTSLVTAPALCATTLYKSCYGAMFYYCNKLQTPPELPVTTLTQDCYDGMFQECSSLLTTPVLPAETLVSGCYKNMFNNCKKITSITCDASNIDASNCTSNWVDNITTAGDFYGKSAASWSFGSSGVPTNWTPHLT